MLYSIRSIRRAGRVEEKEEDDEYSVKKRAT
jgi:hypothetical protein